MPLTKRSIPFLVNFSDGATYHADFFSQGIDYFELLDANDQNAIWGEDWANNSSTYQCAGFDVALMQAAGCAGCHGALRSTGIRTGKLRCDRRLARLLSRDRRPEGSGLRQKLPVVSDSRRGVQESRQLA